MKGDDAQLIRVIFALVRYVQVRSGFQKAKVYNVLPN
jgi:hypothetical protein